MVNAIIIELLKMFLLEILYFLYTVDNYFFVTIQNDSKQPVLLNQFRFNEKRSLKLGTE